MATGIVQFTKTILTIILMALLTFGCQKENNSPNQCGQVKVSIDRKPYSTSEPIAVFREIDNHIFMNLSTLVGKDTLHVVVSIFNWPLISSSPKQAFVNTFKRQHEQVNCISPQQNLTNCAIVGGNALFRKGGYDYIMIENGQIDQIRVLQVNESEKKLSVNFNFLAVKLLDNRFVDTITIAGSFADVCFITH